jgi:hypothetical protein
MKSIRSPSEWHFIGSDGEKAASWQSVPVQTNRPVPMMCPQIA